MLFLSEVSFPGPKISLGYSAFIGSVQISFVTSTNKSLSSINKYGTGAVSQSLIWEDANVTLTSLLYFKSQPAKKIIPPQACLCAGHPQ